MTAGFGMVTNALTKIIGAQVLHDMQTFVAAFDTLFGGFRQRAQRTFELLQAGGTAFLVVAAPEPDALREAAYFVERLRQERMPLAGLVVNRASSAPAGDLSAERGDGRRRAAARALGEDARPDGRAAAAARRPGAASSSARRGCAPVRDQPPDVPTVVVPALPTDVHDLDGLRRVGELLGAQVDHRPSR